MSERVSEASWRLLLGFGRQIHPQSLVSPTLDGDRDAETLCCLSEPRGSGPFANRKASIPFCFLYKAERAGLCPQIYQTRDRYRTVVAGVPEEGGEMRSE
jgi:hypothetical protein